MLSELEEIMVEVVDGLILAEAAALGRVQVFHLVPSVRKGAALARPRNVLILEG